MAKRKIILSRGIVLLFGIGLPAALGSASASAQAQAPSSGAATPSAGLGSSTGKANTGSAGGGLTVVPKDISDLRIAPGDLLNVSVYDAPEFTNGYRVDPAGALTLPLCGQVDVQGLTLAEAAARIEAALKEGQILVQPQVNVDIAQYAGQYVTVMGEVVNPGRVALISPTSLGEVLAESGGVTVLAGSHIRIRHGAGDAAPEEDVPYSRGLGTRETASILVRPGDSVIVPRAGVVYVLGAVNKPGGYVMQEDGKLNVAEALAMSGGMILQANTGGLRVIRRNADGTVLDFHLNYDAIAKGKQAPLMLQAQDVVYVPMSKIKATFSTTTGILSSAASAAIVTR
ncbi:MAG: polysaccharide biosynthesis/export family protein [Terracidiphilus sp.]|jgi:polysaccharide export outer membrane protein